MDVRLSAISSCLDSHFLYMQKILGLFEFPVWGQR